MNAKYYLIVNYKTILLIIDLKPFLVHTPKLFTQNQLAQSLETPTRARKINNAINQPFVLIN
jgi:hypothetical protein